jgi:transmembrane sensor
MQSGELPEEVRNSFEAASGAAPSQGNEEERDAERAAELADLEKIWRLSRAPPAPDGWSGIRARIEREEAARRGPGFWRRFPAPLRLAAMLVLSLGIAGLAALFLASPPDAEWVVATAPPGDRTTVALPDGSVVQLNAETSLSYRRPIGQEYEVRLTGEAYFTVSGRFGREFVVRTAQGSVRVVGTEFNVRARDYRTQVAVVEGAVEFEAEGRRVRLVAGERSEAARGDTPSAAAPIDLATAQAWLRGMLWLSDEPLEAAASELERRFGVGVRVDEAIARRRITAMVPAATVDDAVEAICLAVGAECRRDDGQWHITTGVRAD